MAQKDTRPVIKTFLLGSSEEKSTKNEIFQKIDIGSVNRTEFTGTIGVDFKTHSNEKVKLQIWNVNMSDRFVGIQKGSIRTANLVVLCPDDDDHLRHLLAQIKTVSAQNPDIQFVIAKPRDVAIPPGVNYPVIDSERALEQLLPEGEKLAQKLAQKYKEEQKAIAEKSAREEKEKKKAKAIEKPEVRVLLLGSIEEKSTKKQISQAIGGEPSASGFESPVKNYSNDKVNLRISDLGLPANKQASLSKGSFQNAEVVVLCPDDNHHLSQLLFLISRESAENPNRQFIIAKPPHVTIPPDVQCSVVDSDRVLAKLLQKGEELTQQTEKTKTKGGTGLLAWIKSHLGGEEAAHVPKKSKGPR